jgi:thymidylate synthase (FAD)
MTFFVSAPIFVWREHMRHRMCSYNEESGRYKQLNPVFYIPSSNRPLVQEGKPGSYSFVAGNDLQQRNAELRIKNASEVAYRYYTSLLNDGIAKEVARMVLPVNIYSSAYVTMNLRGLMNFLSLRKKNKDAIFPSFPQYEIELVAKEYEMLFAANYPATFNAFVNNGYVAP